MSDVINWNQYSEIEIKKIIEDGNKVLRERSDYRKSELIKQINEAAAALKREFPCDSYWEDTWDEEGEHCIGFDLMEYFPMDWEHFN